MCSRTRVYIRGNMSERLKHVAVVKRGDEKRPLKKNVLVTIVDSMFNLDNSVFDVPRGVLNIPPGVSKTRQSLN